MKKESIITKDQYDRLMKIAPDFAGHLSNGIMPTTDMYLKATNEEFLLTINHPRYCLVGEAWKYKDDYSYEDESNYCYTCHIHSVSLCSSQTASIPFQGHLDKFLNHFENNHKDLIKQ